MVWTVWLQTYNDHFFILCGHANQPSTPYYKYDHKCIQILDNYAYT